MGWGVSGGGEERDCKSRIVWWEESEGLVVRR